MIDTGPLISLYDKKDSRRKKVKKAIQDMQKAGYPFFITMLTIAETQRRILFDINYVTALDFLDVITDGSINLIRYDKNDFTSAIDIIKRYTDQKITLTDAVNMAIMKRLGIIKVLSYDRHFSILNFTLVPTTP